MPRQSRSVFANLAHHITQTGNRQAKVFLCEADKAYYLQLLGEYCLKHQAAILAYCLLDKRVHLILKPSTQDGLQKVLKPVHMRYTQYLNKQKNTQGMLWQGRFFSATLDEDYTRRCVAYIENAPVRTKVVKNPLDYAYSSARHHAGLTPSPLLDSKDVYPKHPEHTDYGDYLLSTQKQDYQTLVRNTQMNLPCGSVAFVAHLSALAGRDLTAKKLGRPKKPKKESSKDSKPSVGLGEQMGVDAVASPVRNGFSLSGLSLSGLSPRWLRRITKKGL